MNLKKSSGDSPANPPFLASFPTRDSDESDLDTLHGFREREIGLKCEEMKKN
jgi:hypothetical protein